MNHTFPTKRVRYMNPVPWDEIKQWGVDKRLEMADALELLWTLQKERESLGGDRAQQRGVEQRRERPSGRAGVAGLRVDEERQTREVRDTKRHTPKREAA